MAANTIKGNNTAAEAAPTDIAVGTNTVLGRRGGDIVAAAVVTNQIANLNVTTAKIANSNVTNAKLANMDQALIKGRAAAAGTGEPQDLTAEQVRTILNIEDGATANPGTVTSIATGTGLTGGPITGTGTISMANMAALSVKGNATNAVAAPTDIVAGADHRVLRRSGTDLGFGAINLAQAEAVTGTLPVGNGGTGRATLTANSLLAGNVTGAVNLIAPGTSGNVLVSNGTTWSSGDGAGSFIRNQSAAVQNPGTFWINGVGRVGDGTAAAPSLSFNSNANTGLFRAGANILGFSTNGGESMRIQADGKVLIGTTAVENFGGSSTVLQVNGGIGLTGGTIHSIYALGRIRIAAFGDDDNGRIIFMTRTTNDARMIIHNNGRIAIGDNYFSDTPPNFRLQIQNEASDDGGRGRAVAWTTYSDTRIKENQTDLNYGLKEIMQIKPKSYLYKSSTFKNGRLEIVGPSEQDIGFIAQELYNIIPEMVYKPEDESLDLWSVNYDKMTPVLVKAIQEQQQIIENQQQIINKLMLVVDNQQIRINDLDAYITQQKKRIDDIEKTKTNASLSQK